MRSIPVTAEAAPVLEIEHLAVTFATPAGEVEAVGGLTLSVEPGECVGIVGESGAGKSQAFLAVMGLLPANARVRGTARFRGTELLGRPAAELNRVRGAGLAMIFQDPLTSLTPHLTIGDQIAEPLVEHTDVSWADARARALELLERVQVSDPERRLRQYPHELSGGMRQRVMIAIALACGPKLVIADEPTTALDVTIQAQILGLLSELKREQQMSMVLITHDLGIVAGVADRVAVMQAGRVVELNSTARILSHPEHAYTQSLLHAVPRLERYVFPRSVGPKAPPPGNREEMLQPGPPVVAGRRVLGDFDAPKVPSPIRRAEASAGSTADGGSARLTDAVLLKLSNLKVHFKLRGAVLRAVDDVSLMLNPGEVLGIVGESGSGKSTLARAVLRLLRPEAGQIVWLGKAIETLSQSELRPLRKDLQLVFQDPTASLDPRMTVQQIVAEPLRIHRSDLNAAARTEVVADILLRVGLGQSLLTRYPHELSGGQAQRVGIARAMVLKPRLLVCDEAVSALDVSVQAQILALLHDLKREYGTSILFISHNLAVVRQLCDRVLVLYLGRRMEEGPTDALFTNPAHPYTRGLLAAVPVPDPEVQPKRLLAALGGELPSPVAPPSGCVFRTRCPYAVEICREKVPEWEVTAAGHSVACHRWREIHQTVSNRGADPVLS
jgi:peptide/nickel transport system ATP-binding protein